MASIHDMSTSALRPSMPPQTFDRGCERDQDFDAFERDALLRYSQGTNVGLYQPAT